MLQQDVAKVGFAQGLSSKCGFLSHLPGHCHLGSLGLRWGPCEHPCRAQGMKKTCCTGGLGTKQKRRH